MGGFFGVASNTDCVPDPEKEPYCAMVESIRAGLGLTSLRYQRMDALVEAIGLPREKLCSYCWDRAE